MIGFTKLAAQCHIGELPSCGATVIGVKLIAASRKGTEVT